VFFCCTASLTTSYGRQSRTKETQDWLRSAVRQVVPVPLSAVFEQTKPILHNPLNQRTPLKKKCFLYKRSQFRRRPKSQIIYIRILTNYRLRLSRRNEPDSNPKTNPLLRQKRPSPPNEPISGVLLNGKLISLNQPTQTEVAVLHSIFGFFASFL
jgi:hypothetical protein